VIDELGAIDVLALGRGHVRFRLFAAPLCWMERGQVT
jgi:hypothetical protein